MIRQPRAHSLASRSLSTYVALFSTTTPRRNSWWPADAQQRAAALALQAAQERYRVGAATFVEVTLARATLIQAQSNVVTARSNVAFQQALMLYFTGDLNVANPNIDLR